jgi:hypothetical protein
MSANTFKALLSGWVSQDIIIINPESFRKTGITEGVALETYTAQIRAVHDDYIEVGFQAQKKGKVVNVDQFIPFNRIKRASQWGDERYLQL